MAVQLRVARLTQAAGLEPVETTGSPKGGRGNGQQPELRGEGRAGSGDWVIGEK